MEEQTDIVSFIRDNLSAEIYQYADELAQVLEKLLLLKDKNPTNAIATNPNDETILQLLSVVLAGKNITHQNTVLHFGSGNSIGDVNIRDIAGGDIYHVSLNLAVPLSNPLTNNLYKRRLNEGVFYDYLQEMLEIVEEQIEFRVLSKLLIQEASETPSAADRPTTTFSPLMFDVKRTRTKVPRIHSSLEQAFAHYKGRLLLLGEPGSGKTVNLLDFAHRAIQKRLLDDTEPLPIWADIGQWESPVKQDLVSFLCSSSQTLQGEIEQQIRNGRVLLILDGLDELGDSRPEDPTNPQTKFYDPRVCFVKALAKLPRNKVVVSCRTKDYFDLIHLSGSKLFLNGAVTLGRLTNEQIRQYLQDFLNMWEIIKEDKTLLSLCQTPLFLKLFRDAYTRVPEIAHSLRNTQEGDLNDIVFAHYIQHRYEHESENTLRRGQGLEFTFKATCAYLERLAIESFDWRLGQGVVDRQITLKIIPLEQQESFLALAARLEVIFPVTNSQGKWRFAHLRMRDHFAYKWAKSNFLADKSVEIRVRAAQIFGSIGDKRATKLLVEALCLDWPYWQREQFLWGEARSEEAKVRGAAARALGAIGDTQAISSLISVLKNEEVYSVREWATSALGRFHEDEAVQGLIFALQDPDYEVRLCAAGELGKYKDTRVVEPLINLLDDKRITVRTAAAQSLKTIGTPRALEALDLRNDIKL